MDKIPKKENIILAGDFNGRIGNQPIPECIGTYGEQVKNHVIYEKCEYFTNQKKVILCNTRHSVQEKIEIV